MAVHRPTKSSTTYVCIVGTLRCSCLIMTLAHIVVNGEANGDEVSVFSIKQLSICESICCKSSVHWLIL